MREEWTAVPPWAFFHPRYRESSTGQWLSSADLQYDTSHWFSVFLFWKFSNLLSENVFKNFYSQKSGQSIEKWGLTLIWRTIGLRPRIRGRQQETGTDRPLQRQEAMGVRGMWQMMPLMSSLTTSDVQISSLFALVQWLPVIPLVSTSWPWSYPWSPIYWFEWWAVLLTYGLICTTFLRTGRRGGVWWECAGWPIGWPLASGHLLLDFSPWDGPPLTPIL